MLISWAVGYFAYSSSANIHFLLAIALCILVIDLVRAKRS